MLTNYKLAVRY